MSRKQHSGAAFSGQLVILTTSDVDPTVMCSFAQALSEMFNEQPDVRWCVVDGLQAYSTAPTEVRAALRDMVLDWHNPGSRLSQAESVFYGLRVSRGPHVLLMAPDMIANIQDIPRFIDKMDQGFEVVAGWRTPRVGVPLTRRLLTRMFNNLVARLFRLPIHDFNTCMGLMTSEAVDSLLEAPVDCPSPALNTACIFRNKLTEVPITVRELPGRKSTYTFRARLSVGIMRLGEVIRFHTWLKTQDSRQSPRKEE